MWNEMLRHWLNVRIIVLSMWLLFAGLSASAASASSRTSPGVTRVLHFPRDQHMGTLYIEHPSLGSTAAQRGRDRSLPYGLDPQQVEIDKDWDFLSFARGDVRAPAGPDLELNVHLKLRKEDAARLARFPVLRRRMLGLDLCREGPPGLSGLSTLEPNDLYSLVVYSSIGSADADQRILKPIRHLTGLKVLRLHGTGVTDNGMEYLRDLRSLGAVEFMEEWSVGNRGLAVLAELPNLEYLDLDTGATDAGLKLLAQSVSLRWLRIRTGGRIWGAGLTELARLPRLERLCIWGTTPVSDRHIQALEGLSHLKSLTLWGVADPLTDASLASIAKLQGLEELHFIATAPRFTAAGVTRLQDLKSFREVDFAQTWASQQGRQHGDEIAGALARMPTLESIKGISYLSPAGLKVLATLPNLQCLHVGLKDRLQSYHGPTGVAHLAGLDKLEELDFTNSVSLSDADLAALQYLGRLRNLRVWVDDANDRTLAGLGRLHPLEYLTTSSFDGSAGKKGLNELSGLTNLQDLRVWVGGNARSTTDEIKLNLATLKNLRTLSLAGFALEGSDLAGLHGLQQLEQLGLVTNKALAGGDLASLSGLQQLEALTLRSKALPEASLRYLQDLPALNRLNITGIQCTDGSGLASLAGLPGLRDLKLEGRITDRALGQLANVPSAWYITVRTGEPIRPGTLDSLKQALPNLEGLHLRPPWEMNMPNSKPAASPPGPRRSTRLRPAQPAPVHPQSPR